MNLVGETITNQTETPDGLVLHTEHYDIRVSEVLPIPEIEGQLTLW